MAIAIVGVGLGLVYVSTYPGGWRAAFGLPVAIPGHDNITAPGGFTQQQIDYYLGGFTGHLSGAQGAMLGASTTGAVAGVPIAGPIIVGVSAAVGYFFGRQRNDTKNDRETFASRLGFLGTNPLGAHDAIVVSADDTSRGLYPYLIFAGRPDLTAYALNVIGRKDFDVNTQWMVDALAVLWRAGFSFPK